MYPVSVKQAVSRGRKIVFLPALTIFIGVPVITNLVLPRPYSIIIPSMVLLVSLLLAAVYRAYAVPRWMLWAFTNVRNVHELKKRAVDAMLIPGESNAGLRKYEKWTENQKREWTQLELRFNQPDEFVDDPTVPAETHVYFSIIKRVLAQPLYIILIIFGALPFFWREVDPYSFKAIWSYLFGLLFSGAGIGLTWLNIRQMLNRNAQITMSDEGLTTATEPFHTWAVINDLHVVPRRSGRYRRYYLEYYANNHKVELELDGFNMSRHEIDRYLETYQSRFIQRQNNLKRR
jgi:hypothetical protein